MTPTIEELMQQCIKDNPEMHCTINGEVIKLTKDEYDKAVKDWSAMRLIQIEFEQNPTDPANSDYQRYLRWLENPDADESGTL